MKISILNPIQPVDDYSAKAFIQILNMILLANNIVELNTWLIDANSCSQYKRLSGYFAWNFENETFTLRQRAGFGKFSCFEGNLLEISFYDILHKNHSKFEFSDN